MNNIKNKLLTRSKIETLINNFTREKGIIVKVNNVKNFQKAFVHKSFCIVDSDNSDSDNYSSIQESMGYSASNERLEFLGDKVIDLITTEFLFDKFPDKNEGFLTKLKSRMVKKESLAKLAENLGFKDIILLSSHVERISGRDNPRLLEDTFESFIGTLYKDQKSDLGICKCFLLSVYEKFIDIEDLVKNNDNFKDTLLRYFHSRGWGHPEYYCESEEPSCREFKTFVKINDKIKTDLADNILRTLKTSFSSGKTKKIGQQNISRIWLDLLKVPSDF